MNGRKATIVNGWVFAYSYTSTIEVGFTYSYTSPIYKKIKNVSLTINKENGDLYLGFLKKEIYAKCCVLAVVYPIHTMIKTIYHLWPADSLPLEIYKAVQEGKKIEMENKQLARHVFKRIGQNLLDGGRTPLYGLAFTIITLSAF